MSENKELVASVNSFRANLANNYGKQIENFFASKTEALKFYSNVVASIQRTPKLLSCDPASLMNSFITMAQLGFQPSFVSGEAYVLPYNDVAQFQLGYQGIVTLLYRAGSKSVVAEIVRKNDKFTISNGKLSHEIDPFKSREERGEPIGAYAIITTQTGGTVEKFMRKEDILAMGKRFSKSWDTDFSPWKEKNDPELWMWLKTVLKQCAKLAPKNETLNIAIAEDNKDSDIEERMERAKEASARMNMGSMIADQKVGDTFNSLNGKKDTGKKKENSTEETTDTSENNEGGEQGK
jgi:recombination protein RecT